jgi:2-methylcitrate dehydratase PrpD
VPAALAVAEALGASGQELLEALIVGYDSGARIGMGSRLRAEIHPHGTYHNISAAVAVARLSGANPELMAKTIGLAIHLEIMPSFENAYQGRTVRNTYAGVGAASGILAYQLARIDFSPEHDALGSIYGGVISPWLDREKIIEELGERFEITLGFIKPYAMCRFGHPAVEAAEALVKKNFIAHEEIEMVEVRTFDWAATLDDSSPDTDLGAKFSIPWGVASMLVRKSAGADDFRAQALGDPILRKVAARIKVKEDPNYTAMTPSKRPASVMVRTKDGRILEAKVEGSAGGPDAPLAKEKLQEKFRSLAEPIIGAKRSRTILEMVDRITEISDIRNLIELLMPS